MKDFQIVTFDSKYSNSFFELNKRWIEEYWSLEDSDIADLLNPVNSIIAKGGEIFFIVISKKAIGTAAMIPYSKNKMELAKMTIDYKFRGLGLSKLLLSRCISYAKNKRVSEVFLISNSKLKAARKLYDNFGFTETPLDSSKYQRGNYKMIIKL